MASRTERVYIAQPVGAERLPRGVTYPLVLEQIVDGRRGPHRVGSAESLGDGRLALHIVGETQAARNARALLDIDAVAPVLGPKIVKLR